MHREIRNTLAYIIVATLVTLTAAWQAQVSVAKDFEARHRALPPPLKTKHAIRPARQPFAGDLVARCGKGTTDPEIRWIIDDFRNAGLDFPPGAAPAEAYLDYRRAQHRWYRDALADALQLTPEQSAQVAANLTTLYQSAAKEYLGMIESLTPITGTDGNSYRIASAETFNSVTSAVRWLPDPSGKFSPWNLCTLTPQQREMTWEARTEAMESATDPLPGDVLTGIPPEIMMVNSIFPLIATQKSNWQQDPVAASDPPIIASRNRLYPAQIRMLLLLYPELAAKIQSAIDGETKN